MYSKYSQKQTLIFIFCLAIVITLNGCGGGSSKEAPSQPTSAEKPTAQTQQPVFDINNLIAAPDFSFTTKSEITVNLVIEQYQDQRSFVNIYRHYQQLDTGAYYPSPASRVVAGALSNGTFIHSFIGLNQQQRYLVEIWSFDGLPPLQRELTVNNNQLSW